MLYPALLLIGLYLWKKRTNEFLIAGTGILIVKIFFFKDIKSFLFDFDIITFFQLAALLTLELISRVVIHIAISDYGKLVVRKKGSLIYLYNKFTIHGLQDKANPSYPAGYFHPESPVADALKIIEQDLMNAKIASVGLGPGVMATYIKNGQEVDFFEIDKEVIRIATNQKYFTYIANCEGKVNIEQGNALYILPQKPEDYYSIIVVDAYFDDKVPEVFFESGTLKFFAEKLKFTGYVLFHVSTKTPYDSEKIKSPAEENNFKVYFKESYTNSKLQMPSSWILLGKNIPQNIEIKIEENGWEKLSD